jgi:hypothetical protein
MPVIDSQGRVFGRFNLVDALLVVLLIAAVPAAYAARVLFRDPPPQLTTISPSTADQGVDRLIELTGANLRPYMRVSFGTTQAASFQFYGTTQAFVPLPALEPGTYDVVLYDHAREVARLPQAMSVTGPARPPQVQLRLRGAFIGLTSEQAPQLIEGRPWNATEGVIGAIETREAPRPSVARVRVSEGVTVPVPMDGRLEVPAAMVLTCPTSIGPGGVLRCATAGVTIAPDMHLTFQGPFGNLLFRIDAVDAAGSQVK